LAVDLFPVSFTAFRGVSGKFLGSSMTGEVWRAPQQHASVKGQREKNLR
jgi:hypothetical protein